MAENAWNTCDPAGVALAYTPDTRWRNRSEFLRGRVEVEDFLTRKWTAENDYRLIKEIWAHGDARIAVRFCYEYRDAQGQWFRAHGNENWQFDKDGYMSVRHASINDVPIRESERLFRWPAGARPDDHPELSDLGLRGKPGSARALFRRHAPRRQPGFARRFVFRITPSGG